MGFAKLVVNIVEVGNLEAGIETRHRVFFSLHVLNTFSNSHPILIVSYCIVQLPPPVFAAKDIRLRDWDSNPSCDGLRDHLPIHISVKYDPPWSGS
jgi:hypothetical protein